MVVEKVMSYVRDEAIAGAVQPRINSSFCYFISAFSGASLLVKNTNKGGKLSVSAMSGLTSPLV
jgi:hypothetical protein